MCQTRLYWFKIVLYSIKPVNIDFNLFIFIRNYVDWIKPVYTS